MGDEAMEDERWAKERDKWPSRRRGRLCWLSYETTQFVLLLFRAAMAVAVAAELSANLPRH